MSLVSENKNIFISRKVTLYCLYKKCTFTFLRMKSDSFGIYVYKFSPVKLIEGVYLNSKRLIISIYYKKDVIEEFKENSSQRDYLNNRVGGCYL